MPLAEGQTGTAPDGTRVIVRGGQVVPLAPRKALPTTEQTALQAARDQATQAEMVARKAGEFQEINRRQGTGGYVGLNLPFGLGGVSDIMSKFDPDISAMDSISAQVAPQMRPPGSGSSSDKDAAMYRRSFPNVDNLGPANTQIAQRLSGDAAKSRARASFLERWAAENGTIAGGDAAFEQSYRPAATQAQARPAARQASPASAAVQVRVGNVTTTVRPLP